MILVIYCLYGNVVNCWHTSQICFFYKWILKHYSNQWTRKPPQPSPEKNLRFGACRPHLIHQCLFPSHLPPQAAAQLLHALSHNYATKSILVIMGCPVSTPPFAWGNRQPQLTASSWHPVQSAVLPQSNGQTDGRADGLGNRTCISTRLRCTDCSDAANDVLSYSWEIPV